MEYFVGALLTLITFAVANKLISKQISKVKIKQIRYSQSHVYSLAADLIFGSGKKQVVPTQANQYYESQYTKVIVSEDKAYFIKDNAFFVADIVEGNIEKESTKQVDTMSMDDVELKKIIYIVEALKEGDTDDYWYPGKP